MGEVEELGTDLDNYDNLRNPYPNSTVFERARTLTKKRLIVTRYIGQCGFVRTTSSKKMRKDNIKYIFILFYFILKLFKETDVNPYRLY